VAFVLLAVLAAGYLFSFRLRRRIWRARQVSGTRPPHGYWWEGETGEILRFIAVTLVGAALVVLATVRLPDDDQLAWTIAKLAFIPVLILVLVRTRRAR
jgi:hypothetical protein